MTDENVIEEVGSPVSKPKLTPSLDSTYEEFEECTAMRDPISEV